MAQVSITVNANTYKVACADGEEQHIQKLAAALDAKVEELVGAIGQAGEARLLAMAGLLMADDLADLQTENEQLKAQAADFQAPVKTASPQDEEQLIERLETLADHIETIAERVEEA